VGGLLGGKKQNAEKELNNKNSREKGEVQLDVVPHTLGRDLHILFERFKKLLHPSHLRFYMTIVAHYMVGVVNILLTFKRNTFD
jgi:hypothetical protein